MKSYYVIGGNFQPKSFPTLQQAIAQGNRWDRSISARNPRTNAGVDAYVVSRDGDALEFRGLICGKQLIGQNFGCGPAIVNRVRAAISL